MEEWGRSDLPPIVSPGVETFSGCWRFDIAPVATCCGGRGSEKVHPAAKIEVWKAGGWGVLNSFP